MRGIRLFAFVLLGAILIAQFSAFFRVSTVQAADDPLPSTVAELVKQYDKTLAQTGSDSLYHYYKDNIEGKTPPTFPSYGNGSDLPASYENLYNTIYIAVSNINQSWQNFLIAATLNDKLFDNDKSIEDVNAQISDEKKQIRNMDIVFIGEVYYGLKILQAIDSDSTARSAEIAVVGEGTYARQLRDLNVDDSKRIVKPTNLATGLQNHTYNTRSDKIYPSLDGSGGWYPDYISLANLIFTANSLTDDASRKALQDKVLAAAQAIDASDSGTAENPNDSCGGTGITDPGSWLPYAFCNITVAFRDLGSYLLTSGGSLLAKSAGIPGGTTVDNTGLFSFINGSAIDGQIQDKLQDSNLGAIARAAYSRILNLVNGAVLILLIGIALANVLQIQVNVYSFKKLLPGLIIGLILANASYFIVRAGLEVSGYLASGLISNKDVSNTGSSTDDYIKTFQNFGYVDQSPHKKLTKADDPSKVDMNLVFQQFILNFFLWAAAIMIIILGFLFAIRSVIFFLLVPLAPIAFLGLYFPPLSFAWKRWAAMMTNWIFMPVVAFFWLWMGFIWFQSVSSKAGTFGVILAYIFGLAMIWLAMKTPFTLAGEAKQAVAKWNDFGKGFGARYTPYGSALRAQKSIAGGMKAFGEGNEKGPIFKNKIARTLGGDTLNRWSERYKLKGEQDKKTADAISKEVVGQAKRQLSEGMPIAAMKAYGERLNNIDENSVLGKLVRRMNAGDRLIAGGDTAAEAANKAYEFAGRKWGRYALGIGPGGQWLARQFSWGRRESEVKDMEEAGNATEAKGHRQSEGWRGRGNGDARAAYVRNKNRVEEGAAKSAAEREEQDAHSVQSHLLAQEYRTMVDSNTEKLIKDVEKMQKYREEVLMEEFGNTNVYNNLSAAGQQEIEEKAKKKAAAEAEAPYKARLKAVNIDNLKHTADRSKPITEYDLDPELKADIHGLLLEKGLSTMLGSDGAHYVAKKNAQGNFEATELKLGELGEKMSELAVTFERATKADSGPGIIKELEKLKDIMKDGPDKKSLEAAIERAGQINSQQDVNKLRSGIKNGKFTDANNNVIEINVGKTIRNAQRNQSDLFDKTP